MAITKMRCVTISGQISDFDTIARKYIYGRDIHLENALSIITNRGALQTFEDGNEYESAAKSALVALKMAGCEINSDIIAPDTTTLEDMQHLIDEVNLSVESEQRHHKSLEEEKAENDELLGIVKLMSGVNADLGELINMEFVKCRFGKLPKTSFKVLLTYLGKLESFFIKTGETQEDIWGFYFAPIAKLRKTEEIMSSLYFEEISLPKDISGTPADIQSALTTRNVELQELLRQSSKRRAESLSNQTEKLCAVYNLAKLRVQLSEIRRNAAHGDTFFYVVGWMPYKAAKSLEKEITSSGDIVMFYSDDAEHIKRAQPPTKLKNNPIFKPFEMFVKMYGLPSYNEIDPTPILAITYILFFGIMFGDVGQSAVFAILGFILYKVKKMDLAGIVGWVGLSGVVFGFIYGSFFGNEEIIPNLFHTTPLRPMEQAIMMLGATIAMGVVIIIFGLILHIINSVKERNIGEALFGHNGLAGLVFYLSILLMVGNMLLKWGIPNIIFTILIIISLLAMYLSEPLSDLVAGKKDWMPKNGMFFVENLFEMFEVVLSFFTNTISFLRIGAFAIVHVGMMMVVSILTPEGISAGSIIVMVLGNAVVMILEGLIVGIQVLRLEYYEMFSRYFTGRGKEFISLRDK